MDRMDHHPAPRVAPSRSRRRWRSPPSSAVRSREHAFSRARGLPEALYFLFFPSICFQYVSPGIFITCIPRLASPIPSSSNASLAQPSPRASREIVSRKTNRRVLHKMMTSTHIATRDAPTSIPRARARGDDGDDRLVRADVRCESILRAVRSHDAHERWRRRRGRGHEEHHHGTERHHRDVGRDRSRVGIGVDV